MFKRIFGITRGKSKGFKKIFDEQILESLEDRRLMSAVHPAISGHSGHGGPGHGGSGPAESTIAFDLAPTAVQTAITGLASTDGLTAPTSTTTVHLGNADGKETYTVDFTSTGTDEKLTVDQTGATVSAPTQTTSTFGAITNTAVTDELTAIATALSLTAPTSTTTVNLSTASDGTATYSISLTPSSSTSTHTTRITVDSSGNPVGNERVPLSVLSTTIQNALTAAIPSGATALTSTSLINVKTVDGVTLYTATYTGTGTQSTVTVNSSGTLTSLPISTQTTFSAIPAAAQTEIQTLATADGDTTTIAATQAVTELTESNGTVLYTVMVTGTSSTDSSDTYPITITVDADGNPTILPNGGFGGPRGPGGGGPDGGGPGGGFGGPDGGPGGSDDGSGGGSSSGDSGSTSDSIARSSLRRR